MYVGLAKAIAGASRSLPFLKDKGPAQPVCREQVMGEAQLLESNALNYLGKCAEARAVAQAARVSFVGAGEDSFALAIADYYEGSAASFEGDYRSAWKLLRSSLEEFQLYGQENWAGKAEAALGTLLVNRNRNESALHFFDSALRNLHPTLDEAAYGYTLANRAGSLQLLGRLDAAKATYAKALSVARRLNLKAALFSIRYGLAAIEMKRGQVLKALNGFRKIAEDARAERLEQRVVTAELRAAECLGRLGQGDEMLTRVRFLRREVPNVSVAFDPPLRELFAQADEADVSAELVAHVVEYLEARDRGVQNGYRPFKLVANRN
jgi:tetratricopeptide (TPR) repeat protein